MYSVFCNCLNFTLTCLYTNICIYIYDFVDSIFKINKLMNFTNLQFLIFNDSLKKKKTFKFLNHEITNYVYLFN